MRTVSLMGTIVLDPGGTETPGLHLYAHCLRDKAGGVALLAINTDRAASATLRPSIRVRTMALAWPGGSSDSSRSRFFAPAYSCKALPSGTCRALACAESRVARKAARLSAFLGLLLRCSCACS